MALLGYTLTTEGAEVGPGSPVAIPPGESATLTIVCTAAGHAFEDTFEVVSHGRRAITLTPMQRHLATMLDALSDYRTAAEMEERERIARAAEEHA